jgi:hypothetical protein
LADAARRSYQERDGNASRNASSTNAGWVEIAQPRAARNLPWKRRQVEGVAEPVDPVRLDIAHDLERGVDCTGDRGTAEARRVR